MKIKHKFVEFMPEKLEEKTLYISIAYATAVHACFCGCRSKVVTPLSPTDWKLIFNGETVSLSPSIGNWSLPCQSHYWIEGNKVRWAPKWSKRMIDQNRRLDEQRNKSHYKNSKKWWQWFGD